MKPVVRVDAKRSLSSPATAPGIESCPLAVGMNDIGLEALDQRPELPEGADRQAIERDLLSADAEGAEPIDVDASRGKNDGELKVARVAPDRPEERIDNLLRSAETAPGQAVHDMACAARNTGITPACLFQSTGFVLVSEIVWLRQQSAGTQPLI